MISLLRTLDLSFNRIRKIENLDRLLNLKKLFLPANKIAKIENLDQLVNLELLELGDNKIRVFLHLLFARTVSSNWFQL